MGFLADLIPQIRTQISDPNYLERLPTTPRVRAPSLRQAVRAAPSGFALVVERKHFSPGSETPALPDVPLDRYLASARAGGADALSCLATAPEFRGSPEEVAQVVEGSRLPVLFKDFILDPVQVEAAFRTGASAVLLIARLERGGFLHRPLRELALAAHARGLEVLLEVHDPEDWAAVEGVAADVFGINLRDLDSLRLRPETAAPSFRRAGDHRPLLGLSGVASPAEAERYRQWGADGVLVGSGFARASDPARFLQSLRGAGERAA